MAFLKKYIRKYLKLFLAAVACLTLEAFCDLMQPAIMSKIIDTGVAGRDMGFVFHMGAVMLMVTALGAAAAVSRNIVSNHVSQRFGSELRSDLFKKIQMFSFDNINRFETSSLVTRLTNDVTQVQTFVNGTMRIFVKAPLLCIGSIVMAILLNPGMAPILAAVVPAVAILIIASARTGYPFFKKVQKMLDGINGVMREYLAGVRVVKAFNRFVYETERFGKANNELASVSTAALRVMALFSPGITLVVNIGIVAVLWLGGFRVNNGRMHVGQVIAFINYMTQILTSLMMISFVFNMFVRARASTERIREVMLTDSGLTASLAQNEGHGEYSAEVSVEFDHVWFSYTDALGKPVLKDVSFSCWPGETIGIIGSTGSGKSSLVSLIPCFYKATSGSVLVDGINVENADLVKLRDKIAFVPQKTILFTGTILDNIRWGKEDADLEQVRRAAETAQADSFISAFPEGYDTLLGQGGVNLSGGQKQRISIARALVRMPRILILDDCTSAVDMVTEARIRETVKEYAGGMTCFIITQRIVSVMGADRIIVLDNGEMAGIGTHENLMDTCEVYRDIFRSQIGREEMR